MSKKEQGAAAPEPADQRVDPSDGGAYTFAEMSKFYAGTYKKLQIMAYWDNCKSPAEPKAKAKVKAKAKAKAKTAPKPPNVIKVGDTFPDFELHLGFPPDKVALAERFKDRKVIFMGLPGAFTPCSGVQVPEYLKRQDELKAKGIDEIVVYCVNDGAVMKGWAKEQGIEGSMITFMADPQCKLTRKLGMMMRHPGPMGALGNPRCKRFVLVLDNLEVKAVSVSEAEGDPAGNNDPEGPVTALTRVDHILTLF